MRKRYIQNRETMELVEVPQDYKPPPRKFPMLKFEQEPFLSPIDGSIISNARQLRAHNKEHDVIDAREWGNDRMCNLDAEKERLARLDGTSKVAKEERIADIKKSIEKVEAGAVPLMGTNLQELGE